MALSVGGIGMGLVREERGVGWGVVVEEEDDSDEESAVGENWVNNDPMEPPCGRNRAASSC